MQKNLYTKIIAYLRNNIEVKVSFVPALKYMEVTLGEELRNTEDVDFFKKEFEYWFYNEANDLMDYAQSSDYYFEFNLKENELLCDAFFVETSEIWPGSDNNSNYSDIFSEKVLEILMRNLNIHEEDFERDSLDINLEYERQFNIFEFYYDDVVIKLSQNDENGLKKEIEPIITSWGNHNSKDIIITREIGDHFIVELPVNLSFVITMKNEG